MGLFDKLFGAGPKSAEEWWRKGRALVARGRCDQAIACFDKALDLDPGDTANYAERGNAYLLKGDADAAIADLTQFIRGFGDAGDQGRLPLSDFEVEEFGDITVANFSVNKIGDEQSIQAIGEQLFSLVDELGRKKILLNLGNVEYLTSAALGKFVALNKKLDLAGGRLALCNVGPQIYEVLEISNVDKLFKIEPHPAKEDLDGNLGGVTSRFKPPSATDSRESRPWRKALAIAHANRGAANSCKGNHDAAIADYTDAILLDPGFANAYYNRGVVHRKQGQQAKAEADFAKAKELGWEPE